MPDFGDRILAGICTLRQAGETQIAKYLVRRGEWVVNEVSTLIPLSAMKNDHK
jgi:hypothetical protein